MVWLSEWDTFLEETRALYASSLEKARFTLKSNRAGAFIILKATDDTKCLKYRCSAQKDLKKVESFVQLCTLWVFKNRDSQLKDYPLSIREMGRSTADRKINKKKYTKA
ncbi:signal recognition particle (SRP9) domain-containing protein [Cardiosporidium cionae]|uniref:Signal recognition particle (SRP9) domain-containing protein n=1 Tax=Cardiosporidium cionae TaxID=476202 RepID=A0ABQ7JB64_9APIC|nr:signal recognition particle (SRP9) domain-containing protein [Cardiosporidium cionae]|eukprot:KAF8821252.1 signal recognition particle (SRP9) domain-containing protein [Cardiosporidium cionae]